MHRRDRDDVHGPYHGAHRDALYDGASFQSGGDLSDESGKVDDGDCHGGQNDEIAPDEFHDHRGDRDDYHVPSGAEHVSHVRGDCLAASGVERVSHVLSDVSVVNDESDGVRGDRGCDVHGGQEDENGSSIYLRLSTP